MTHDMTLKNVLQQHFVKALIHQVCGDDTQLVERDHSFAVRQTTEGERDIHRVILLPPKGYTANAINQMNSHDEAESATIAIKGAVKSGKHGFSRLKDCLFIASHPDNGAVSGLHQPYLTYDVDGKNSPELVRELHSAGTAPFPVVKSNGYGFYHNLVNVTDEWLALKLHKRLRPQKSVDLEPYLTHVSSSQRDTLNALYAAIVKYGDGVFNHVPELIDTVTHLPLSSSLPALGEMLYVHDSGMHEACTAFAIILKIGKQHPEAVSNFLNQSLEAQTLPSYYAKQLIHKIGNHTTPQPAQSLAG